MPRTALSSLRAFSRPRALPRLILAAVCLAVLGALAWWYLASRGNAPPASGPGANSWNGPVPVRVTPAQSGSVAVRLPAIGTVTPLETVTIRSQVDGRLVDVAFQEGQMVEKGQLLARIDPERYQARLAVAQGQLMQTRAQLKQAEAELARYRTLRAQNSIASRDLEAQQALVEQLRGAQVAGRAQADEARMELRWTRIEAPIAGRAGFRNVDPGNLVSATDTEGLVVITRVKPISVVFSIPAQRLDDVRGQLNAGLRPAVEVRDSDNRRVLARGQLRTVDNRIDVATGTVRLKAEFDNEDAALFPNQFVNVSLDLRRIADAVTIPVDAVLHGSRGSYVYVIEEGKAHVRQLKAGADDGERVVVQEGLSKGDQVVLEGLDRLREGREVMVVADPPGPSAAAPAG